jgi:hypothetical protein
MDYDMIFVCSLCGAQFIEIYTDNGKKEKNLDQVLMDIMMNKPSVIHRCNSDSRGMGSFRGIKRGKKTIYANIEFTE